MMSSYDRWVTSAPEYDEPELTGLAAEAQALVDRLYETMNDMCADYAAEGNFPPNVTRHHIRLSRIAYRADKRVQRRMAAQDASACGGWGCVDGCGDCDEPTCPFCDGPAHVKQCQPQRLAFLLSAYATAWWRDIESSDFEAQVTATRDAYLAGGGNDAHYNAHWRAMSDAAKEATTTTKGH